MKKILSFMLILTMISMVSVSAEVVPGTIYEFTDENRAELGVQCKYVFDCLRSTLRNTFVDGHCDLNDDKKNDLSDVTIFASERYNEEFCELEFWGKQEIVNKEYTTINGGSSGMSEKEFIRYMEDENSDIRIYLDNIYAKKSVFNRFVESMVEMTCKLTKPTAFYGIWEWQYCSEQKKANHYNEIRTLNGLVFEPKV